MSFQLEKVCLWINSSKHVLEIQVQWNMLIPLVNIDSNTKNYLKVKFYLFCEAHSDS